MTTETAVRERGIVMQAESVRAILAGTKTQTRRVIKPQPPEDFDSACLAVGWYAPTKIDKHGEEYPGPEVFGFADETQGWICPYVVGQRLYVKEAWAVVGHPGCHPPPPEFIVYRADYPRCVSRYFDPNTVPSDPSEIEWRSPMFMPRWASRLTLEVMEVRVRRLQSITREEALAEGVTHYRCGHPDCIGPSGEVGLHYGPRGAFYERWDSLHSTPKPIKIKGRLSHYVSYPWEEGRETRKYRGLPWRVYGNPLVYSVSFKVLKRAGD